MQVLETLMQPYASLRHQEINRYPLCPSLSLAKPPGSVLRQVSPAILDTSGCFAFLLFRLHHPSTGLTAYCVRGSASFPNDQAIERLYTATLGGKFRVSVQGGGRMSFGKETVQIYGASQSYGRSDHHVVGKLVKFCFPRLKVQYEPAPGGGPGSTPASSSSLASGAAKKKATLPTPLLTHASNQAGKDTKEKATPVR